MPSSLVLTKLEPPRLPALYLERPRLDELWETCRRRRVLAVTAGAGFGKTAFLARAAGRHAGPVAWLSLEAGDADSAAFARLFEAALRRALGRPVDPASEMEPEDRLGGTLALLAAAPAPCLVVLDDLHLVAGAPPVRALLERLLRQLPATGCLALLSREALDLPLTRLRAAGELASLGAAELAFSAEEIAALYALRFPGKLLPAAEAARIATLTEGWAAGVGILFQGLAEPTPAALAAALAGLRAARGDWFAYFAEEVLAGLPAETRRFLRAIAILPRQEPALCDALLGSRDAAARLAELARRNCFLAPDAAGGYRLHALFRDCLREQLARHEGEARRQALLSRAAGLLRQRGDWIGAAAASAEAGDSDGLLALCERQGEELLATGQYSLLRELLVSLPAARLAASASALHLLGRVHEVQGRFTEAARAYRAALRRAASGPRRVELLSLLAQLAMRQGNYRSCLRLCDRALAEPGLRPAVEGRLLGLRGVSACDLGRLEEGAAALVQAGRIFRRRQDALGEGRVLYLLVGNVYGPRGEFREAKRAGRRSVAIFRELGDPRRICHSLGVLGWALVEAGELREAADCCEEALRIAERLEYATMLAVLHYSLGRLRFLEGEYTAARAHLERAQELGEREAEAEMRSIPHLALAELDLAEGNRLIARRRLRRALAAARSVGHRLHEGHCETLLGLAAAPGHEGPHWQRAERLLGAADAQFERRRLACLRLDRALAAGRLADAPLAEFLSALAASEHERALRVQQPAACARLWAAALARGIEAEHATRSLDAMGEAALAALAPLAESADEGCRLRLVELLGRLGGDGARGLLARLARGRRDGAAQAAAAELSAAPGHSLHVRALGPLEIERGEDCLRLEDWPSRRALRLFQLLLVQRFRWVPQEQILEALWPEADPQRSRGNLRQSIFQLRRLLDRDEGPSHVQHRQEACRLDPGAGHRYDVAEFEAGLAAAEAARRRDDAKGLEAALRAALALYRGDFLAESPYEEMAVLEREGLRDRFLRALERLLGLLAKGERWAELPVLCRQGLERDPYAEGLHWHLIEAQRRLGQRREALADYQRYERLLIEELDLPPSPRLRELGERLRRPDAPPASPTGAGPSPPSRGPGPSSPPSPRRRGAGR
ncbi:tetratricopeptide repeat protein [bacterium]|nr:tetratricopeptide repeat protein [bacterium]